MKDCASEEYGLEFSGRDFQVFGKLEAPFLGGSVKSRAAAQIVHEAIRSGRLRRGMVVFEATSGNFGIALGLLGNLGVKVVVLVSRKLQDGVLEELDRSDVKTVDLDVDVCPAPGMQMDPNMLLAKVVATNMRDRFSEIGLDVAVFDASPPRIEELLARQDVINLAKLFAEVYGGFCPEQYDNEQNVNAHAERHRARRSTSSCTGSASLEDFRVVCAFGTGGHVRRAEQVRRGQVRRQEAGPRGLPSRGTRRRRDTHEGQGRGAEVLRAGEVRRRARGRL